MFSVAPNIVLAPNMTQNAERKHRTQDANTAHFQSSHLVGRSINSDCLCLNFSSISKDGSDIHIFQEEIGLNDVYYWK